MKYRRVTEPPYENARIIDVMDVSEYYDDECKRCSISLFTPQTLFTISDGETTGTVCQICMIYLLTGKIPEYNFIEKEQ